MNNETASLELVEAMQEELRNALNSLAGKTSNGLLDHFVVFSAKQINWAADGYICLRKASKVDASKLLIRPSVAKPLSRSRSARNRRTAEPVTALPNKAGAAAGGIPLP